MARAFVGVGSNIEPMENVRAALRALAARADVAAVSTVYETEPVGRAGQPRFYNCAAELRTGLRPRELKFEVLRPIEAELGRRRGGDKYAPRPIDLDLVLYEDLIMDSKDLVLPDPEIWRRPFLAIALRELAPGLVCPGTGMTLAAIAAGLRPEGMRPLPDLTAELRAGLAAPVRRP